MITHKIVVIDDKKEIAELGNIRGPITTPEKLPIELIRKMVHNRRYVYEVNPYDRTDRIRLDVTNIGKTNFFPPVVEPVQPTNVRNMTEIVKDARGVQPNNNDRKSVRNDFKKR